MIRLRYVKTESSTETMATAPTKPNTRHLYGFSKPAMRFSVWPLKRLVNSSSSYSSVSIVMVAPPVPLRLHMRLGLY